MRFKLDPAAMAAALPQALLGWLGVFVVTAVIISAIYLLNASTGKRG